MTQSIDIGINEEQRHKTGDSLARLLADSYTLYLKTHNFHWNVTGALFQSLHLTFETQYIELAEAVDLIAERIRALGFPVHATYHDFAKLTSVKESEGMPLAQAMVRELVESHEVVIKTAREACQVAEQANDQATLELLAARLCVHEKAAWMLRSSLEQA